MIKPGFDCTGSMSLVELPQVDAEPAEPGFWATKRGRANCRFEDLKGAGIILRNEGALMLYEQSCYAYQLWQDTSS